MGGTIKVIEYCPILNWLFLHSVVGLTAETLGPRILIMGASGAGKSSVLNACFGAHVANISHCLPCTQSISYFPATERCPIHLYDTKGFETQSTNEDGEGFARRFDVQRVGNGSGLQQSRMICGTSRGSSSFASYSSSHSWHFLDP